MPTVMSARTSNRTTISNKTEEPAGKNCTWQVHLAICSMQAMTVILPFTCFSLFIRPWTMRHIPSGYWRIVQTFRSTERFIRYFAGTTLMAVAAVSLKAGTSKYQYPRRSKALHGCTLLRIRGQQTPCLGSGKSLRGLSFLVLVPRSWELMTSTSYNMMTV